MFAVRAMPCMASTRRARGSGTVYIKWGNYYGRWYTATGGRRNRKLGPVRRPGTATGLTRAQAEKRLRALIDEIPITADPDRTVASVGVVLLSHLEAKGRSRSHRET